MKVFHTLLFAATVLAPLQFIFALAIPVPNFSFETPDVEPPVAPTVGPPWEAIFISPDPFMPATGTFDNTAPGSDDHIDNMDGAQAIYVFAGDMIGVFQDLTGTSFEIGKNYTLTIGLAGSEETLETDSVFELLLYYRDATNARLPIQITQVLFDPTLDPGKINQLYDYSVSTDFVQAGDAWEGKDIGIELRTNAAPGGYWVVDNVRLDVVPEPSAVGLLFSGAALVLLRRRA